jgi:hypothetical protein
MKIANSLKPIVPFQIKHLFAAKWEYHHPHALLYITDAQDNVLCDTVGDFSDRIHSSCYNMTEIRRRLGWSTDQFKAHLLRALSYPTRAEALEAKRHYREEALAQEQSRQDAA